MRCRWAILLVLACTLATVVAIWWRQSEHGPAEAGNVASVKEPPARVAVLISRLESGNIYKQRDAAYELAKMGGSAKLAIPALIKVWRESAKNEKLFFQNALLEFGAEAAPIALDVAKSLEGMEDNWPLIQEFKKIGPAGIPVLLEAFKRDDRADHCAAIRGLSHLGEPAPKAIEFLMRALEEPEPRYAANALASNGPAARLAVPALLKRLEIAPFLHRDGRAIIEALGKIGDPIAVPHLVKLYHAPKQWRPSSEREYFILGKSRAELEAMFDNWTLSEVRKALARIGGPGTDFLQHEIENSSGNRREDAIESLAFGGLNGEKTVAKLISLINTSVDLNRQTRLIYVALFGIGGPEADKQLVKAPASKYEWSDSKGMHLRTVLQLLPNERLAQLLNIFPPKHDLSNNVAGEIAYRGQRARSLEPFLNEQLRSPDRQIFLRAVGAVGSGLNLDPGPLVRALDDADPAVRLAAATALEYIGKTPNGVGVILETLIHETDGDASSKARYSIPFFGEQALPAVEPWLKNGDTFLKYYHFHIKQLIISIGPRAARLEPSLIRLTNDPNEETRRNALMALVDLRSESPAAFDAFKKGLDDSEPRVRRQALRGLRRYYEQILPLLPRLIALLDDKDIYVRDSAALTIARLGPAAKSARPKLMSVVRDNQIPASTGAFEALRQMGPDAEQEARKLYQEPPTLAPETLAEYIHDR